MDHSQEHTFQQLCDRLSTKGEFAVERLDHWAATTPERPFFHYGEEDKTYSYREFGLLTDAIAGNLAANGLGKGDRLAVFTTNPLLAALMMFAAWKAGAVYAPVNFSFKGRLLSYQLQDTAPQWLVTDPGLMPAVNAVAGQLDRPPMLTLFRPPAGAHDHVATVELPDARFRQIPWEQLTASAQRPDISLTFDDAANIVYTSGTTGPAKGVLQSHRWIASYTYNLSWSMSPADVIYNDLPMYHIGGAIANVVRAAWVGCEVAVWDRFSPTAFWSRIASRGATTAILLDVMMPWLMKASASPDDRSNTLNKVHMQPLPMHHHEVAKRFGIDIVTAGFGQTESGSPLGLVIEELPEGEATPAACYRGLPRREILSRAQEMGMPVLQGEQVKRKGVMGRPTPFVEVAVLDEHDCPCPVGQPGQLAIRTRLPGVLMTEYLGKPAATVSAWRNLWFHTGDAAVLQPDGMYDFVDRLGDRIRVRGENLSSFQVEDMLNQHPQTQMVAAFAVPGAEGDEDDIVAFVVPIDGSELCVDELHRFVGDTMPKYMRPKHIRLVTELPRTPTNKVEKYKLRAVLLNELQASNSGQCSG